MALEPSELILNADGSIYHLALKPEHLAETILTVGDPGRVPRVSAFFDAIEHQSEKREFRSCTGRIGKRRFTVLSTGIGTDNIDIALNELDALVNLDLEHRVPREKLTRLEIIRLGTSGSLQADLPVDALVVSSHGLGLDGLLHFYRDPEGLIQRGPAQTGETEEKETAVPETAMRDTAERKALLPWPIELDTFPLKPYLCAADHALLSRFPANWVKGITATCPGFYGPQGRSLRLEPALKDLPERLTRLRIGSHRVTNFEMETAAIYGLGALLGHRCVSVNVILANRVTGQFSGNASAAVDRMIRTVLETLTGAPAMPS